MKRLVVAALLAVSSPDVFASDCYKAIITDPVPFNGNGGELIVLDDGTIWKEVSYQYLYLYEYYPTVIVCPSRGSLHLGDDEFSIVPIGRLEVPKNSTTPQPSTPDNRRDRPSKSSTHGIESPTTAHPPKGTK